MKGLIDINKNNKRDIDTLLKEVLKTNEIYDIDIMQKVEIINHDKGNKSNLSCILENLKRLILNLK